MINLQNNKREINLRRDYVTGLRNYPQNCAIPPEYNRFFTAIIIPRLSRHEKYTQTLSIFVRNGGRKEANIFFLHPVKSKVSKFIKNQNPH